LVDNAVALTVQLIFLRQTFIAGGQALGIVLRLAVLNIELQNRVLDGLTDFRPQGGGAGDALERADGSNVRLHHFSAPPFWKKGI
jgi:hypothetical protein